MPGDDYNHFWYVLRYANEITTKACCDCMLRNWYISVIQWGRAVEEIGYSPPAHGALGNDSWRGDIWRIWMVNKTYMGYDISQIWN